MKAEEILELRQTHAATDTLTPIETILYEIAFQLATFNQVYQRWKCLEYGLDEEDPDKWKSAESCGVGTPRP